MNINQMIKGITSERDIKHIVWIAAGGSNGGNYPGHYFLDHEAKRIYSHMYTSNEFVYAVPEYVDEGTLAIIVSMRGTPETCKAAQIAQIKGTVTIALYVEESELTRICNFKIKYESIMFDESDQSKTNAAIGLRIAVDILNEIEGYPYYEQAMKAFDILNGVYEKAKKRSFSLAKKWAELNKNEQVISVLASGPSYAAGYIFSICNIMEMLQIASPTINCCEFFHGPFEILDEKNSMFLLISEGRTRELDLRVYGFLKKHGGEKVYILDIKELGISDFDESVREYFNHLLFAPILNNVYMKALSESTGIDYRTRKYMLKEKY